MGVTRRLGPIGSMVEITLNGVTISQLTFSLRDGNRCAATFHLDGDIGHTLFTDEAVQPVNTLRRITNLQVNAQPATAQLLAAWMAARAPVTGRACMIVDASGNSLRDLELRHGNTAITAGDSA